MRRMTLAVCTLAAALAVTTAPAHAQNRFWIGGAAVLPSGDFGDGFKTGFAINAGVKAWQASNERASVWVEGLFGMNDGDTDVLDVKSTMIGGYGTFSYTLTASGSTRPYLLGSLGYLSQKIEIENVSGTEGGLGFGGGLGVSFGKIDVEARYWSASINDGTTAFLTLGAGISF
ncbi:MAG TPA: outer membrane beta-barrel protein [Gemmatimonadales bacterium]|nr:outer membrane beta-barrel protein [Gemmatimonadales bacterium]